MIRWALLLSCWLWTTSVAAQQFKMVALAGMADELTAFAISHRDPNFVLVGTAQGKILRSDDGGATWQEVVVAPYRSMFFGRERQADPRFEYALGLPGKSPHLQSWLRSKGLHTSGVNWQQLLVRKGDKPVRINWIEVDWHDDRRVWVGTPYGLYRSLNKGRSFLRIWQGRKGQADRSINAVVTDPADPKKLLVGTAGGLFVSRNRGTTFKKEMNFYVYGAYVRGLFYDPEYQGIVHMSMGGAAMASPDGGDSWITTHWHLWHPRSAVQWISLGPDNLRLMATGDGVWASWQGGEMGTWQRRGYRFAGVLIDRVMATKDPKVWYAANHEGVWVSEDSGNTWRKVMQLGAKERPVWLTAFGRDANDTWFLTNRHLYRTKKVLKAGPANLANRRLLDIPTLHNLWRAIQRYKRLYFKDVQEYRDRAPLAALLPSISFGAFYGASQDIMKIRAYPHFYLPWLYFNAMSDRTVNFEVFANWELGRLIFDKRELPHFGRIERNLQGLRAELTERIHVLYNEYRRVASQLVYAPPNDLVALEFQRLRLQEIVAMFDHLSGGYWSKHAGGLP